MLGVQFSLAQTYCVAWRVKCVHVLLSATLGCSRVTSDWVVATPNELARLLHQKVNPEANNAEANNR